MASIESLTIAQQATTLTQIIAQVPESVRLF